MRHPSLFPTSRRARLPAFVRTTHSQGERRQQVGDFWIPPVKVQKQHGVLDATHLLTRAGYLRQAYAGVFQMLPLGLRVQEKLERLIDKHMRSIGASRVSLSSISSQSLWEKSGRFKPGGEVFTFQDRKGAKWLLAPTHEEEITTLLADIIQTRQQLPVRLYQIGRKYRDEKRPRGGLLRGREFLMKDLYTFDSTPQQAHQTYDQIRAAYRNFLDELKVRYIEARAVSGDMGGDLSHEYHFPNSAGEDVVITCSHCDYSRNEEYVSQRPYPLQPLEGDTTSSSIASDALHPHAFIQEVFLSTDGHTLVRAIAPSQEPQPKNDENPPRSLNSYAIKAVLEGNVEIDSGLEDPEARFVDLLSMTRSGGLAPQSSIVYLLDSRVPRAAIGHLVESDQAHNVSQHIIQAPGEVGSGINLLKHQPGDACPECKTGKLTLDKAIEIGHTFHLGTRYSSKLGLSTKQSGSDDAVAVEMGCHGIGVSRLIAAVASCLSDETGLNWPAAIAPFQAVVVVPGSQPKALEAGEHIYDELSSSHLGAVDVILDSRPEHGLGWKLKDADLIGYPVLVVVGRGLEQGKVEIQCRRLKIKQEVETSAAGDFVRSLLKQL